MANSANRVEKVSDHIIAAAEKLVEQKKREREETYDKNIEPVIEKFIKERKYIVMNSMILRKMEQSLDLSETNYFYEVYAGNKGFDDLKKLADALYQSNSNCFTYLEVVRIGEYTFDLKSNFETILRVISLLDRTFQKIPYYTDSKTGLRYLDPNLMRLNVYDIYCNPTTAVDSWRAAYQTEQALDKLFPLEGKCDNKKTDNPLLNEVYNHWITNNPDIILTGDAVLNVLLKIAGDTKSIVPVNHFVVLAQNPEQQIAKLRKLKLGELKTKKEKPSLRYYKERTYVYLDGRLVAVVYNVADRCYPYTELSESLKVATVHLLIKFYLIEYINSKEKSCILKKIDTLLKARKRYLEDQGMTGIEKGPFQVFHHICWGNEVNIKRQLLILGTKRKYVPYRYKPWEKFSKLNK